MQMLDAILAARDGGAVNELGRQFGLSHDQATAALSALVPAITAGLSRNARQEGGLASLAGALAGGGHARFLDDLASLGQPATTAEGNGILGHVFGSKDVSRQVAARAAESSGVGADVLKRMLPVVAAMVMGSMATRASATPRPGPGGAVPGGDLMGMLAPMLDADGDGSVVDDLGGMLGTFLGGR